MHIFMNFMQIAGKKRGARPAWVHVCPYRIFNLHTFHRETGERRARCRLVQNLYWRNISLFPKLSILFQLATNLALKVLVICFRQIANQNIRNANIMRFYIFLVLQLYPTHCSVLLSKARGEFLSLFYS